MCIRLALSACGVVPVYLGIGIAVVDCDHRFNARRYFSLVLREEAYLRPFGDLRRAPLRDIGRKLNHDLRRIDVVGN